MRTHTLEVMDDDGDLMQFETNSEDPGSVAITWSVRGDSGSYTQVASLMFDVDDIREIRSFLEIAIRNHVMSSSFKG
jgi:hypothetical protein